MPENRGRGRMPAFAMIGAYLLVVMYLIAWLVRSFELEMPQFVLLLAYYPTAKILGDLVYYRLRPQYRDFGSLNEYFVDDTLALLRLYFPLTVAQRMLETSFLAATAGPLLFVVQLLTGPLVAVLFYLLNRYLREEAADSSYHPGERLHRLP